MRWMRRETSLAVIEAAAFVTSLGLGGERGARRQARQRDERAGEPQPHDAGFGGWTILA